MSMGFEILWMQLLYHIFDHLKT